MINKPNYDFVDVDPKVIAAFGGDSSDDYDLELNEDLEKPSKSYRARNMNESSGLSSNSFISSIMNSDSAEEQEKSDIYSALMKIASELNQIKVILAGK